MQVHLIANSHLDPVWLWDWREGLNEALITVRTVLKLMDEDKSIIYNRGEAVLYRHIEETDPDIFAKIAAHVRSGRWDVIGGTYLQPDTNLAGVETLSRQFTEGQRYFQNRFGRRITAGWQADSFGHTAGLPEVLRAASIDSFAFTRPDAKTLPLAEPAFWWEGEGGARILAYRPLIGWYGADRDEMPRRLDGLLEAARNSRLQNVACFYGLGNHGGGPTRRQLADIRTWADAHPEVKVLHSGLHGFFAALRLELKNKPNEIIPTCRGELNFCLRGCYSSMARFKALYRRGENILARAEKTDAAVASALKNASSDLSEVWRGLLFNSFHDILPGSSIERAMEDQTLWMGGIIHGAQKTEFRALNQLAQKIDTRVVSPDSPDLPSGVAFLAWNPNPYPFQGHLELDACLDYRPIMRYQGRPEELPLRVLGPSGKSLPFQEIAVENQTAVDVPWRKRVLVPVQLPALGWSVFQLGWVEGAVPPKVKSLVSSGRDWIENGEYKVEIAPNRKAILVSYRDKPLFGKEGLTAVVFEDSWGSWGGMREEPESYLLRDVRETWTVANVARLESGPERATLWVRLAGKHSRIELTFSVCRKRPAVDVEARLFWAERGARLKLLFPVGDRAQFEVPGAVVERGPCGEVPGGRWVGIGDKFGLASDALYNFDCHEGRLGVTVVRGTHFATEQPIAAKEMPWRATGDLGEMKFRFLLTAKPRELPRLSRELEQPPSVLIVPSKPGPLPRQYSVGEITPASLRVLAIKRAENGLGYILRVQAPPGRRSAAKFRWQGSLVDLGAVNGGEIASWILTSRRLGWTAVRVDLSEDPWQGRR